MTTPISSPFPTPEAALSALERGDFAAFAGLDSLTGLRLAYLPEGDRERRLEAIEEALGRAVPARPGCRSAADMLRELDDRRRR